MEEFIGVKYKLKSSDNFENYLKYIQVGLLMRKAALAVNPTSVLTYENGFYTLTMSTSFRTVTTVFRLGEEFDEDRADGTKVKSVFTVEGNKLIQVQIEACGRKSKHVREYNADKIIVTSTAESWDGVCTRIYERIN